MDIRVIQDNPASCAADVLMLLIMTGELGASAQAIDERLGGAISEVIEAGDFDAKVGAAQVLYTRGAISAKRVMLVGLGDSDALTADTLRRAAATGVQKARDFNVKQVAIVPISELAASIAAQAITEGATLGLYRYHGQKSSDVPEAVPETLNLLVDGDATPYEEGIAQGLAFAQGAMLSRDLVNLPPNIATPSYLAQQAQQMAQDVGLSCEVLGRQQMAALKMGALLGVAQGSDAPPQFIIMEHNGDKKDDYETIVLVGKGVTFDTGGYSLKSRDGMVGMKGDMGGGAAVIGAMRIIAKLDVPLHVVGLVPASDNMVSSKAYRPQEVLTASNGKTIEIISTDAEGRLLLADALVYAQRYKPDAVVDIATLTGSIAVALGRAAAGVYSNSDKIVAGLDKAGATTHERIWRMPIFEEYGKPLESDTADTKNSGGAEGRFGGAGVAAVFLSHFVDFDWAHIDMAGMLRNDGSNPYAPKHSTIGYGARLLAEFVREWSEES